MQPDRCTRRNRTNARRIEVDTLVEWVKADPEKVMAIFLAELEITTGRVEIHYHGGRWGVVCAIHPERRVTVKRSSASGANEATTPVVDESLLFM